MNDNKQNKIHRISLEKLYAHPGNPNRMSKETFTKLVHNIERTGRYEPIIVRRLPPRLPTRVGAAGTSCVKYDAKKNDMQDAKRNTHYEIINGHHRVKALRQLGYKTADCLVWDVDDHEAEILLATLNRLGGSDTLEKKLALLKRLNERMQSRELAKLLPHTAKQIERLTSLKLPSAPAAINRGSFLNAVTFFVNNDQYKIIHQALDLAAVSSFVVLRRMDSTKTKTNPSSAFRTKPTSAQRNAAALTRIAEEFIERTKVRKCEK